MKTKMREEEDEGRRAEWKFKMFDDQFGLILLDVQPPLA